jgi:hypothetical protein
MRRREATEGDRDESSQRNDPLRQYPALGDGVKPPPACTLDGAHLEKAAGLAMEAAGIEPAQGSLRQR